MDVFSLIAQAAGEVAGDAARVTAATQPPPAAPHWVQLWHWFAFTGLVAFLLIIDLAVFHRRTKEMTLRSAAISTLGWFLLAMAFAVLIMKMGGTNAAFEFVAGYLMEWSLSMDNVFVFALIFAYFKVPQKYQYRVLFWGIIGAVVMRLLFVVVGGALLHYMSFLMLGFGAFLIWTSLHLFKDDDPNVDPENNLLFRFARKLLPISKGDTGERFFVHQEGRRCMTPLFVVLLVVESSDVMFAVDSVPAVFGLTKEPFIVFSSNIFAILGLRALYFLLGGVMGKFRFLNYGLALVLMFIGVKMIADYLVGLSFIQARLPEWLTNHLTVHHNHLVPVSWSLGMIVTILGGSIVASWLFPELEKSPEERAEDTDSTGSPSGADAGGATDSSPAAAPGTSEKTPPS